MSYILAIVVGVLMLAADQYTKYLAIIYVPMIGTETVEFIPGVIGFWRTHNGGAAWSFLEGHTWLLLSVTIIIMLICVSMLLKYGLKDKLLFWALTLVLSGGIGNLIDRIFRDGEVVDFIYLQFMNFPLFNVADCTIVIGAGLMILYFILDMLKEAKKRKADSNG